MGGTSCDVALVQRRRARRGRRDTVIAGHPLHLPMLDVRRSRPAAAASPGPTPAGRCGWGPRSAGARPGPRPTASAATEPTVTDANVVLGRLPTDAPLGGAIRLDPGRGAAAVAGLAGELGMALEDCAEGIVAVAVQEMVRALRLVSVERGEDPREAALHRVRRGRAAARLPGGRRARDAPRASPRRRPACWPPWAWSSPASAATTCRRVLAPVDAGAGLADRLEPLRRRAEAELPGRRATAPRPTAATPARATPSPCPGTRRAPEARLAAAFHAAHRAPLRRRRRRAPGRGRDAAPGRRAPRGAARRSRAEAGDARSRGPGRRAHGRGDLLGGARAGSRRGGRRRHARAGARADWTR